MLNIFKRTDDSESNQTPQSLMELADQYINAKLSHSTSRNVRGYIFTVTRYSEFLKREPVLSDLGEPKIGKFLKLRLKQGLKLSSVATEQNRLYALWRFAFDQRYVDEAPAKKPISYQDRAQSSRPKKRTNWGPNFEGMEFL